MNKAFILIGDFLTNIAGSGKGLGWSILNFTAIITVFMLVSTISEIRSLQLADLIRPLHEGILNKYQNRSDQMAKELIRMNRTFGYNPFLGMFSNVIHIPIVILLAGAFFDPQRCLPAFYPDQYGFLWLFDLTASPLDLIRQCRYVPEGIAAVLSLLLLDILMSWNFQAIIKKSLMPVRTFYKCISLLTVLVAFLVPQAVTLYFVAFYFLKNLVCIVFVKYFPYSLNKAQSTNYKEFAGDLKRHS